MQKGLRLSWANFKSMSNKGSRALKAPEALNEALDEK